MTSSCQIFPNGKSSVQRGCILYCLSIIHQVQSLMCPQHTNPDKCPVTATGATCQADL